MAVVAAGLLCAANPKVEQAKAQLKDGKFEQAISALEAEHKAKPKDDEVRLALADAKLQYGESVMNDRQLPPFRKYPTALRQFRQVLELDKNNKKAQSNIALIEGIYKQMGRPVPQ